MKKRISMLVTLSTFFLLAGCQGGTESADTSEPSGSEEGSSPTTESEESEAVSGATQVQYTDLSELEEQYDVVIIGAGGGGMSAAISAKDAGLNPVVFEKMPVHGGNTIKASAGMNASETKFQEVLEIEDTAEAFIEETIAGGHETNNRELVEFMANSSADAIDWLDSLGITLDNLTVTGGMSVERTHRPTDGSAVGEYLVSGLYENIQERDIPVFVDSEVTEILMEDGRVSGVNVDLSNEGERTISSEAVIIATGGFGANMDMITELTPELEGYVTTNHDGATGDGVRMAEEIGGDVVDMDQIQIHPTVEQETSYLITEAVRGEGAILVNKQGERFVNEMETRDHVSAAINELEEGYAYLIFDSGAKNRVPAINTYMEQGFVVEAESIENLAAEIGTDETMLIETLSVWNESVTNGTDEAFGRQTAMDNDLSSEPFYAIQIAPGIHHTMGGIEINTNAEVLRTGDTVIAGLYAAGEVTGGVHGSNRIGGNAVTDIVVYGRQAGLQVAEYIQEIQEAE